MHDANSHVVKRCSLVSIRTRSLKARPQANAKYACSSAEALFSLGCKLIQGQAVYVSGNDGNIVIAMASAEQARK